MKAAIYRTAATTAKCQLFISYSSVVKMVYTARFWHFNAILTTDVISLNNFHCEEEVLRDINENGELKKNTETPIKITNSFGRDFRDFMQS